MREKIIAIIEKILKISSGTITVDTRIENVEEWDSLAQVMIIAELDEQLGIYIPIDEAMEIEKVSDFFAYIED